MFSNLPTMLRHQDHMARHSDMLAAARSGVAYPKGAKVGRQIRVRLDVEEMTRLWSKSVLLRELDTNVPPAKVGTTLRIRLPRDEPPPIVTVGDYRRMQDKVAKAEAIIADHQRLMADNIRLREQQEVLRPGMSRADFLAAVAQSCESPIPPPSSPD